MCCQTLSQTAHLLLQCQECGSGQVGRRPTTEVGPLECGVGELLQAEGPEMVREELSGRSRGVMELRAGYRVGSVTAGGAWLLQARGRALQGKGGAHQGGTARHLCLTRGFGILSKLL